MTSLHTISPGHLSTTMYLQLPDQNSRCISRCIYKFLAALQNSYVFIPLSLSRNPLTMFCGTTEAPRNPASETMLYVEVISGACNNRSAERTNTLQQQHTHFFYTQTIQHTNHQPPNRLRAYRGDPSTQNPVGMRSEQLHLQAIT